LVTVRHRLPARRMKLRRLCGVSGGSPGPRFRRPCTITPRPTHASGRYFGSLDPALTRPTHRQRTLVGQNTCIISWPGRAGISLAAEFTGRVNWAGQYHARTQSSGFPEYPSAFSRQLYPGSLPGEVAYGRASPTTVRTPDRFDPRCGPNLPGNQPIGLETCMILKQVPAAIRPRPSVISTLQISVQLTLRGSGDRSAKQRWSAL
jgi:hypothetical protein